jgi:transposase-like protein
MPRYRSYSLAFKRQLVEEFRSGASVATLSRRYDISRALIRLWTHKAEAGDFDEERVAAELIGEYEARIAALERLAGKQALELEFLKRALELAASRRSETPSVIAGPPASASHKDAG